MRRLGVFGANLPTRKSKQVEPADFLIGCIIGQFERKYNKAFLVKSPTEKQEIFGYNINSSWYGSDAVKGFFDNIVGVDGKLYIKSHVGYTGTAIDAVIASVDVDDQQMAADQILTLQAAYQQKAEGAYEYGVSGNRTGYKIENGNRFETTCKTANLSTDTFVILNSVSDIKIGDIMKFVATAGGGATVYKKIINVDESTGKVSFTGAFDGAANMDVADIATVLGFKLSVYRKDINGVEIAVDTDLAKIWCTTESEVTDYYVENIFSTSKWIDVTCNTTTPADIEDTLPADVATVTYLVNGVDGTAPTTLAHWANDLILLNSLPVRLISNPETTDETIQKAIETYCKGRDDNPKVIYNIGSNKTKAQLITEGNNYQRSDDVLGTIVADWLKITDPFSTSVLAPKRITSGVGHVQGVILRTIGLKGVHCIPQKDTTIFGIDGLDNSNIKNIDDDDRTDIANAGINIIQNISGYGYVIRNLFTPSISLEFKFFNAIMMRDYIKISEVDSLQGSENEPNSIERIKADRDACVQFLFTLWLHGSTGNVTEGETFGQSFDVEGKATKFVDHVQVIADPTNNSQASINAGERNINTYFTFPAPAGSIKIGVGVWLKS